MSSPWSVLNSIKRNYARKTSKTTNPLAYCPLMEAESSSTNGARSNVTVASSLPLLPEAAGARKIASEFPQQQLETEHKEHQYKDPMTSSF